MYIGRYNAKKRGGNSPNNIIKSRLKRGGSLSFPNDLGVHQFMMIFNEYDFKGEAQRMINKIYTKYPNIKFIDLSADFRIQNPIKYKRWYNTNHKAHKLIKSSLYSISEFVD